MQKDTTVSRIIYRNIRIHILKELKTNKKNGTDNTIVDMTSITRITMTSIHIDHMVCNTKAMVYITSITGMTTSNINIYHIITHIITHIMTMIIRDVYNQLNRVTTRHFSDNRKMIIRDVYNQLNRVTTRHFSDNRKMKQINFEKIMKEKK